MPQSKTYSTFSEIYQELMSYIDLQKESSLMTLSERLSLVAASVILGVALLCVGLGVLMFLSFAFVHLIASYVGGLWVAYLIMAGILILLMILLFIKRRSWIVNPLLGIFANILLGEPYNPARKQELTIRLEERRHSLDVMVRSNILVAAANFVSDLGRTVIDGVHALRHSSRNRQEEDPIS